MWQTRLPGLRHVYLDEQDVATTGRHGGCVNGSNERGTQEWGGLITRLLGGNQLGQFWVLIAAFTLIRHVRPFIRAAVNILIRVASSLKWG